MFTSRYLVESKLHCYKLLAFHSAQPCCLVHPHFQLTEYIRTFCTETCNLQAIKDQAIAQIWFFFRDLNRKELLKLLIGPLAESSNYFAVVIETAYKYCMDILFRPFS